MAKVVRLRVVDGVAIVTMMAEPLNALVPRMRAALSEVFDRVAKNADVKAAILTSSGPVFSTGTDVREFDEGVREPSMAQLCARIEACPKPVIAACDGQALGSGADLMLAAHYRVASARARVGFGDVAWGLTPSGGATQRLPRLVGGAGALDLLLGGQTVDATAAHGLGLFDQLVSGDLMEAAQAMVTQAIAQAPRPTAARRAAFVDARTYQRAVSAARATQGGDALHAPQRIIDCIEAAALLPFEAGLAFEADAFERCLAHPQSRALRHIFLAERRIDPILLERVGGAFRPVEPMGSSTVARLQSAMTSAAKVLVEQGRSTAQVDAAMIAYGFAEGPFRGSQKPQKNQEIADRLIGALLVEAILCVDQGAVQRPADIDALAVHGLGFPRHLGGPFQAVQTSGLLAMRKNLIEWAQDSAIWAMPPQFEDAIKQSRGFFAPQFDQTAPAVS